MTQLTNQDVHYLLGTIDIAEGETGGDYSDLKNKLFALYPQVKKETDEEQERQANDSKKQSNARQEIADKVFSLLDSRVKILPQLTRYASLSRNYDELRKHYSDEICLSADLWKYHLEELKEYGLLQELRDALEVKGREKGSEWMKDYYRETTDKDLWHELSKQMRGAMK